MQKVDGFSSDLVPDASQQNVVPESKTGQVAGSYWDMVSTAASYIPGVSYFYPADNSAQEALIDESIKGVFFNSVGRGVLTLESVAEGMNLPLERVLGVYNSIAEELAEKREGSSVVSFYHEYNAGNISIAGIARETGFTEARIREIFNNL